MIPAARAAQLFRQSGADEWALEEGVFREALERSVAHRFANQQPSEGDVVCYLDSLHVGDLALACACASGNGRAWDRFVTEYRPVLYKTARSLAPESVARELADSMYGELYGLDERDGERRSLFRYFHGRSSLAGWLRAVVSQRVIDRARERRREEPLGDRDPDAVLARASPAAPPDPDRARLLPLLRSALLSALQTLEPRDRLRLSLYYARSLTLAQVGRTLGEHEATVSRKLERTRRAVRTAVERALRTQHGLSTSEVSQCFEYATSIPEFGAQESAT